MRREELGDLAAFLAVAEETSFTRAAARLGTSQSALSHTIRRLETRLGLRLLTRTTRSVATTQAGERLIETLRPALADIDGRLAALTALREKAAGTIRITTGEQAAERILLPALTRLLPHYPDIKVELSIDYGLTDIVAERFDAGVRLGEQVAKDMIAVPISPDLRMAVVGSPAYLAAHPAAAVRSHLHQSAPAHPRRALRLGVREGRAQGECACRWPAGVQHRRADRPGRRCRNGPGLPAAGCGEERYRRRQAGAGVGRLVPALPRLSPLLSQPPPAIAGLRACGRGAALPPGAIQKELNAPAGTGVIAVEADGPPSPCLETFGLARTQGVEPPSRTLSLRTAMVFRDRAFRSETQLLQTT
jgi:DNA-binding transcriptional LysR family regulator